MSIYINLKEIFPTDSQEVIVSKAMYNFNQLLELGVGKKGDPGVQGEEGPIGPDGDRGDQGIRGSLIRSGSDVPTIGWDVIDTNAGDQYIQYSLSGPILKFWEYKNSLWDENINLITMIEDIVSSSLPTTVPLTRRQTGNLDPYYNYVVFSQTAGLQDTTNDSLVLADFDIKMAGIDVANLAGIKGATPFAVIKGAFPIPGRDIYEYNAVYSTLQESIGNTYFYTNISNSLKIGHNVSDAYEAVFNMSVPEIGSHDGDIDNDSGFRFKYTSYESGIFSAISTYIGSSGYLQWKYPTSPAAHGIMTAYSDGVGSGAITVGLIPSPSAIMPVIYFESNEANDHLRFHSNGTAGAPSYISPEIAAGISLGEPNRQWNSVYSNKFKIYAEDNGSFDNWYMISGTPAGAATAFLFSTYNNDGVGGGPGSYVNLFAAQKSSDDNNPAWGSRFAVGYGFDPTSIKDALQVNGYSSGYYIGRANRDGFDVANAGSYTGHNVYYNYPSQGFKTYGDPALSKNGGSMVYGDLNGTYNIYSVSTTGLSDQSITKANMDTKLKLQIKPQGIGINRVFETATNILPDMGRQPNTQVQIQGDILYMPLGSATTINHSVASAINTAPRSLDISAGRIYNYASFSAYGGGWLVLSAGSVYNNPSEPDPNNVGGAGGVTVINATSGAAGKNTGGAGGYMALNTGNGGDAEGGNAIVTHAGDGGDLVINIGNGGNSLSNEIAGNTGGHGGGFTLNVGMGGDAAWGAAGDGGDIQLFAGAGGNATSNVGVGAPGGYIHLKTGTSGLDHNSLLANNGGDMRLELGLGGTAPNRDGRLHIFNTNTPLAGTALANIYGTAYISGNTYIGGKLDVGGTNSRSLINSIYQNLDILSASEININNGIKVNNTSNYIIINTQNHALIQPWHYMQYTAETTINLDGAYSSYYAWTGKTYILPDLDNVQQGYTVTIAIYASDSKLTTDYAIVETNNNSDWLGNQNGATHSGRARIRLTGFGSNITLTAYNTAGSSGYARTKCWMVTGGNGYSIFGGGNDHLQIASGRFEVTTSNTTQGHAFYNINKDQNPADIQASEKTYVFTKLITIGFKDYLADLYGRAVITASIDFGNNNYTGTVHPVFVQAAWPGGSNHIAGVTFKVVIPKNNVDGPALTSCPSFFINFILTWAPYTNTTAS